MPGDGDEILWWAELVVFSPDLDLVDAWSGLPEHVEDPRLDRTPSWGFADEPEGLHANASLRLRATNAEAAESLARTLLDRVLAAAPEAVRAHPGLTLDVSVGPDDDDGDFDGPRGPADFESKLRAVPWHRSEPTADGRALKVVWFTGPCPLERVDVSEDDDEVVVTLLERWPPAFAADGIPIGVATVGFLRCVDVPLGAPAGDRRVVDGATGSQPSDIVPGNYHERGMRSEALAVDLGTFPCLAMPSGEPVSWETPT